LKNEGEKDDEDFSVIRQGEALYLSNLHNKLNDPWDETSFKG